jgi:putative restriction endonuclease
MACNRYNLTEILPPLAEVLIGLIGDEAKLIASQSAALHPEAIPQAQSADLETWEHHIEATIESDSLIPDTDRKALIVARRGQGLFKQRVMQIENRCRVTGVNNPVHLVGSHCKPWRDSSNEERLDGKTAFC